MHSRSLPSKSIRNFILHKIFCFELLIFNIFGKEELEKDQLNSVAQFFQFRHLIYIWHTILKALFTALFWAVLIFLFKEKGFILQEIEANKKRVKELRNIKDVSQVETANSKQESKTVLTDGGKSDSNVCKIQVSLMGICLWLLINSF